MQYQPVVQATPLKIEEQVVDEPLKISKEGNAIITEQRQIHMTKAEFKKSIRALSDRIGYLKFQIGAINIDRIQQEINDAEKKKNLFESFLNKL